MQYEVKFSASPEIENTFVKKKMFATAVKDQEFARAYIFDGSSLFTPLRIHADPLEKYIDDESK